MTVGELIETLKMNCYEDDLVLIETKSGEEQAIQSVLIGKNNDVYVSGKDDF